MKMIRIDTVAHVMERRAEFLEDFARRFGLDVDLEEADRKHVAMCGRMGRSPWYRTRRWRATRTRP